MEKMARQREGGEKAAVSLETISSRLDDELRLDLFSQRRTKQGLALAFQRGGRGCGGDVGASKEESGVLLIMATVGLCHDVVSTD
jgi:hypothetical protein